MTKTKTFLLGVLCFAMSLTAPFVVPFALWRTGKDGERLAWPWYDTPDLDSFIGLYEPQIQSLYDKYGWFVAAYVWYGLRNRTHGFDSLWAREAPGYWTADVTEREGLFWIKRQWLWFQFTFGWQVYNSRRFASGYEYRPQLSLKTRRIKPTA